MYINPRNIVPVTGARTKLNEIVNAVSESNYYIISKGGKPKAAVVDIDYLEKLQKEKAYRDLAQLAKSGQKSFQTFLDKKSVTAQKLTEAQVLKLLEEFLN